jgi:hypothetical protein
MGLPKIRWFRMILEDIKKRGESWKEAYFVKL